MSEKRLVAAAAYTQLANDATRTLDNAWEGSAKVSWSIVYQRANGTTATLKNINRYADPESLPAYVGDGVATDIAMLQANPFEDVSIVSVSVAARFDEDYRAARVSGVQIRKAGAWTTVKQGSVTKVARGKTYSFRTVLSPVPGAKKVTEYSPFTVTVPTNVKKTVKVALSAPYFDDYEDYEEYDEEGEYQEPTTFAAYVAELDDNSRSDIVERTRSYTSTKGVRSVRSWTTVAPTVVVNDGKTVSFTLEAPALPAKR